MRRVSVLVLLTCSLSLRAQSPLGTVTGLASDPSGAAIPQAKVTVTNKQTGVASVTATNAAGAYTLPNLPPGSYQLAAEAKGFRPLETAAFPVDAFRTVRQDLKFEVASTSTEVTVSATASTVIQTESPAITAALSTKQILDLPTNLRSVFGNAGDSGLLFVMAPLTIPGLVQVGSGATWTIPGGSGNALNAKVDGILTTFANFGSPDPVSQPSMEAVQEFTANVLTNRAEFGGMGTITSVTRTGTNQYHGGVFWYVRNSAFDARNTFSSTKPGQNIHNYGATFGGPLKKDKTFFQLTFDGTQGSRAYLFTSNVPTLAQRRGDLTGAAALRNPFNGQDPFIGNTIRPEFLSSQALKMQNRYFPLPNYGDPSLTAGNYRAAFNGPETHGIGEVRLDHNLSSGHSLFGRYQSKIDDYEIPGVRSELPPSTAGTSTNIRTVNFFTVGDSYAVRPNLFNEFRAGFVMLSSKSDSDVKGQTMLDEFGIQGLPPRVGINGVPNLAITGYSSVTQRLLNPVNDGHWQASDNVSWIRGKHSIKFGGEVVHWLLNRYMPVEASVFGSFSVTNRYSGHAYADFLMGLPTSVTRVDPYPAQYTRWNDISFYVQDDFKMTSRLSLSYGLRYEFNGPPSVRDNNLYSFDEASGSIVVPDLESLRLFSPAFPSNLPVITAQQAGPQPDAPQGGSEQFRAALRLLLSGGQERQDGDSRRMGRLLQPLLRRHHGCARLGSVLAFERLHEQHRERQADLHVAGSVHHAGGLRHARADGDEPEFPQRLRTAVQHLVRARTDHHDRRARQLHRLARIAVALHAQPEPAAAFDDALRAVAPSVSAVQQYRLLRERCQQHVQRTSNASAEALLQRIVLQLRLDPGPRTSVRWTTLPTSTSVRRSRTRTTGAATAVTSTPCRATCG